jgi:hypothetical protein
VSRFFQFKVPQTSHVFTFRFSVKFLALKLKLPQELQTNVSIELPDLMPLMMWSTIMYTSEGLSSLMPQAIIISSDDIK